MIRIAEEPRRVTIHRRLVLSGILGSALPVGWIGPARADEEVVVLAAGAVKAPLQSLIGIHAKLSPTAKVTATFDTVGAIKEKVLAGATPDLLILSEAALKELKDKGKLARNQYSPLGRTGIGLCTPETAAAVDISSPEKLKAALLAAPSIVHADPARGATAGLHFRKVLGELGIAEQVAAKVTVVPFGGEIAPRIAKGEFAIGVSQASELTGISGVRFAGHLPPPHDLWTIYGLASVKGIRIPDSSAAELALMMFSNEGAQVFQTYGFER